LAEEKKEAEEKRMACVFEKAKKEIEEKCRVTHQM
jgi:hypothetical protein